MVGLLRRALEAGGCCMDVMLTREDEGEVGMSV